MTPLGQAGPMELNGHGGAARPTCCAAAPLDYELPRPPDHTNGSRNVTHALARNALLAK